MLKDDRLGESFYILVGEEFNKPTNMGQECSDTNLVKRYKSLCIDNSKNIAYRDDSMDELVGDIKGIIGEIGLPKEELILEIEKIRYKISREARNGGFANTHIPDIINFLNSILVIFLYLKDMTSLKIIQYFNEKFGYVPAMLIGSILLFLNYLSYTFKDRNYEEIVNKYHDFLIRVINSSDF